MSIAQNLRHMFARRSAILLAMFAIIALVAVSDTQPAFAHGENHFATITDQRTFEVNHGSSGKVATFRIVDTGNHNAFRVSLIGPERYYFKICGQQGCFGPGHDIQPRSDRDELDLQFTDGHKAGSRGVGADTYNVKIRVTNQNKTGFGQFDSHSLVLDYDVVVKVESPKPFFWGTPSSIIVVEKSGGSHTERYEATTPGGASQAKIHIENASSELGINGQSTGYVWGPSMNLTFSDTLPPGIYSYTVVLTNEDAQHSLYVVKKSIKVYVVRANGLTPDEIPPAPTLTKVSKVGTASGGKQDIKAEWKIAANAVVTSFDVEAKVTDATDWTRYHATADDLDHTFKVSVGSSQEVRVRANNSSGSSPWSNTLTFDIQNTQEVTSNITETAKVTPASVAFDEDSPSEHSIKADESNNANLFYQDIRIEDDPDQNYQIAVSLSGSDAGKFEIKSNTATDFGNNVYGSRVRVGVKGELDANTQYTFAVKAVLSHKTDTSIATSEHERQHTVRTPAAETAAEPPQEGGSGGSGNEVCTPQSHDTPDTYLRLNFDDNTGTVAGALATKDATSAPARSTFISVLVKPTCARDYGLYQRLGVWEDGNWHQATRWISLSSNMRRGQDEARVCIEYSGREGKEAGPCYVWDGTKNISADFSIDEGVHNVVVQ